MADGYPRFNPGGQYLPFQNHPLPRGIRNGNGSPLSSARGLFSQVNDTPSPNRSPGTRSPAHTQFGMHGYGGGNHSRQIASINGGGHANYQSAMGFHGKSYAPNHGNQVHHMNSQAQEHGHGYPGHQYTGSGSTLNASTPHYAPAHLSNGTPDQSNASSHPPNQHWQDQEAEYDRLKNAGDKPHFYARNSPHVSRFPGTSQSSISQQTEPGEHGDRRKVPAFAEEVEETGSWDAMDLGGHGLRSMGASIFRHYPDLHKIYFNHNLLTWLPPDIGSMRSLTVLDLSFNKLDSLPAEIGMLTNLKKLLLYGNNLRDLPAEIGTLFQLETLGVVGNNMLRADYMQQIRDNGTKDFVRYLREQASPPEAPLARDWIDLIDPEDTEPEKFSVCSWNILCDRAATAQAYGYTPSDALAWDRRRSMILNEVTDRNADILCLQEIDVENYNEYFRPNLATEDYKGVFWPKGRAQTMGERESRIVDGCAIFFKNSKYIQLDKQMIQFSRDALQRPDMKGEADVYNRIMPKDHIAIVLFLENRATGSRLIVVNTHLAWEGWQADVKLVQVGVLMDQLTKLTERYAKWEPCTDKELFKFAAMDREDGLPEPRVEHAPSMKYDAPTQIPLLVCGDFNSLGDSGVYDLITQGSLSSSHSDFGDHKYGDFTRNGISHPFSFKSVYSNIGNWPWTNYTPDFREIIDYVWYSTNSLQPTGLLGEVDQEYMKRVPGFPNWHFPSDHLALFAEFQVKGRKERKVVEADFGTSSRRDRRDG
ncbi:Glucose-repressible alcohol dehydrogenase transcriptional effector [Recurvomyces mirabilis]|nr:Glucose-repressible alcohol dehydrogenase transcriptional effector [Recurvomyces mirabilis]